jgi:hypothetical protein
MMKVYKHLYRIYCLNYKYNNYLYTYMNISNLAKNIFLDDIKPLKSIQIEFEDMNNSKELFQSLVSIFTEGMILLFGNNGTVDLNTISSDEFMKIIQYFKSFGIQIFVHKFYIKQIENMENRISGNTLLNYKYDLIEPKLSENVIQQLYPDLPTYDLMKNYKLINSDLLTDYKYQLRVKDSVYIIYFDCL